MDVDPVASYEDVRHAGEHLLVDDDRSACAEGSSGLLEQLRTWANTHGVEDHRSEGAAW